MPEFEILNNANVEFVYEMYSDYKFLKLYLEEYNKRFIQLFNNIFGDEKAFINLSEDSYKNQKILNEFNRNKYLKKRTFLIKELLNQDKIIFKKLQFLFQKYSLDLSTQNPCIWICMGYEHFDSYKRLHYIINYKNYLKWIKELIILNCKNTSIQPRTYIEW